jgi:hypothetical protein
MRGVTFAAPCGRLMTPARLCRDDIHSPLFIQQWQIFYVFDGFYISLRLYWDGQETTTDSEECPEV